MQETSNRPRRAQDGLQAQDNAAQTEAQAAREELKRARYETALAREAAKVGIDPSLLTRLVEPEYDAEGKPSNVGAAVAAVSTSGSFSPS